eukprot:gene6975-biopygen1140
MPRRAPRSPIAQPPARSPLSSWGGAAGHARDGGEGRIAPPRGSVDPLREVVALLQLGADLRRAHLLVLAEVLRVLPLEVLLPVLLTRLAPGDPRPMPRRGAPLPSREQQQYDA